MNRENYNDLYAFYLAACDKNFSRASEKLGISPPALSKTIRLLEKRLGLQLFHRTTRTVSLTQAGEQLFATAQHSFGNLNNELERLAHYRDNPSGKVKITLAQVALEYVILPKLADFNEKYPNIELQFITDTRFVDIVAEGFDAGVRLDDAVGGQMIAARISEPLQTCVVGSPDYFAKHPIPKTPDDLAAHQGIAYLLNNGKIYDWQFVQNGETLTVTPPCAWQFNGDEAAKVACLQGLGLAYIPKMMVGKELADGRLIQVLQAFCPSLSAFYLYYPHRNVSPALRAVVECLRV